MRIGRLKAKDVMRLEAVDITPEGNMVVIGGQNAQGKTSVLNAIACALAGKSAFPEVPVRRGAKHAEIVCELDEFTVTRQIDANGKTHLIVAGPDGAPKRSPQSILDALVGRLTFDPLEFSRMDRKAQAETLRELLGLDFTDLDAKREAAYSARTDENREAKRIKAQVDAIPDDPDAPDEPVDAAEVSAKLQEAVTHNAENQGARDGLAAARERFTRIEAELDEAKQRVKTLKARADDELAKGKGLAEAVDGLKDFDIAPLRESLENIVATNERVRERDRRLALLRDAEQYTAAAAKLTDDIEEVDAERAKQIASAEFPVEGLGFDEDGVTFNGLPFSQASSAEQLRTSIAMGFAANPELRILLIRDGSLLDDESLQLIGEMADERDGQIFIERVGDGPECQVIIEDGRVKGASNGKGN